MKIRTADFLTSAQSPESYPAGHMAEVAFAGRSNVGKSSLLNSLLGRHNLVRTSKTPGHTRKLNFFLINESFIFVDFPGYGFARVPEDVRRMWRPMMETYLQSRRELAGLVLVVDIRHGMTDSDLQMAEFAASRNIPLVIAATKADKLNRARQRQQQKLVQSQAPAGVPVIILSATHGLGKNELWKAIKTLIDWWRTGRERDAAQAAIAGNGD